MKSKILLFMMALSLCLTAQSHQGLLDEGFEEYCFGNKDVMKRLNSLTERPISELTYGQYREDAQLSRCRFIFEEYDNYNNLCYYDYHISQDGQYFSSDYECNPHDY